MNTPPTPPKRWSFKAKAEVVIRLLRGEPLDVISRETQVPVHKLEEWRERALASMEEGLKERCEDAADPAQRQLAEAQTTIGKLTMELELYRGKDRTRTR
jgi:transposase